MTDLEMFKQHRDGCYGFAIIAFIMAVVGDFWFRPLLYVGIGGFVVAFIVGLNINNHIENRDTSHDENRP